MRPALSALPNHWDSTSWNSGSRTGVPTAPSVQRGSDRSRKTSGIGMESDNGVGFFTALNARIAFRIDADGERLSLAQCRPDEQSHGHGIEKNRRGMAPQAI